MPYQYKPGPLPFLPFTQHELTCEHCNIRFLVSKSYLATRRYCSRPCEYAAKRTRYLPFATRFWALVAKTEDDASCWLWQGFLDRGGYGMVTLPRLLVTGASRTQRAHRVAWTLERGPIPDGLYVCHRCDNPPCVRPDHLFLGNDAENQHDAIAKGRSARGERGGMSKLTDEKVREIRRLAAAREVTQREIAAQFGVTVTTIEKIVGRRAWKHV